MLPPKTGPELWIELPPKTEPVLFAVAPNNDDLTQYYVTFLFGIDSGTKLACLPFASLLGLRRIFEGKAGLSEYNNFRAFRSLGTLLMLNSFSDD